MVLFGSIARAETAPTPTVHFYINASGPLGDGSGSSAPNAADASTAAKHDALINAHLSNTTIVYAAGTYVTNSALHPGNNFTVQGAGIDQTIIKIANSATHGADSIFYFLSSTVSNSKFFDFTIDLNASNQTWWSSTGGASAFSFCTADHCTIQRVKFIHMGAKGAESFPVFFVNGASGNGNLNNNLIDSCIFTQPIVSGNTGGLTCIYMVDAQPNITVDNTNVVSNCQFLDLDYPNNSDLQYTQCVSAPVVTNNFARGTDTLVSFEPGSQSSGNNSFFPGQTVQITNNTTVNAGFIVGISIHPNGTFGNLNVANNSVGMMNNPFGHFGFRPPTGFSINAYSVGNPGLGNITIQNNTFTAPVPYTASPCAVYSTFTPGSGDYFHVASLAVINNTFGSFPQDGKELQVTTDPAYNPNYTHTGNVFSANSIPAPTQTPAPTPTPTPHSNT